MLTASLVGAPEKVSGVGVQREGQWTVTSSSTAVVPTDRPARYGKQLVSHMSRRHGGEWNEATETGWIDLSDGSRADVTVGDGSLNLSVSAASGDVERLDEVLGRHLVRFGIHDELTVAWIRADGTPGTRQSSD